MEAPMKHNPFLLVLLFGAYAFSATKVPSGPAVGSVAPDFKVRNLVTGEDVTLSSQRGKVVILAAIRRPAANWQINVMRDRTAHVARLYAVSGIPHLFMIGRDGKVVANHIGYGDRTIDELIADINSALAAPLPQD
jgi:hypothetical protein